MKHRERAVWAALLIGSAAAVSVVPSGVAVVGAVQGGLAALLAIGLVLVYQAHRFVHLGHAALGAVAGSAVTYLVGYLGWNYWFAYPAGLAVGAVLGLASGVLFAERLADASRVVVVVCSIGVAFLFGGMATGIALATGSVLRIEVPIPVDIDLFPVRLSGAHVLAALTAGVALVMAWLLLRRSDIGLRIRALATGPVHARRMGIDPHRTWRALWAFCGLLAAAAGIAAQPLVGTTFDRGPVLGPLLLALTAAVVAGMRDLPLAAASAVALGIAHQAVSWHVPIAATADVLLLGVIVVVVLLRTIERVDRADPDAWRFVRSVRPVDPRHRLSLWIVQVLAILAVVIVTTGVARRATDGNAQRIGTIAVFALAAIAVHVSATFGGRLSLGHWAIAGTGTVVASIVGPASPGGALLAIAAGASLALVLSIFFLRSGTLGYLTATFAVAAAFPVLQTHAAPAIGADASFGPFELNDPRSTAVAIVLLVALIVVAVGVFRRSRIGASALAVREDRRLAGVHGVAIVRTTFIVEAIAGSIAGLAGFCYLWSQGTVHPDAFAATRSLELVAMAVVGGIGSVGGAVLGATVVQTAQLFAEGPLFLLSTAGGILVVAVWLRGGLASLVDVVRAPRIARPAAEPPVAIEPSDRFGTAAQSALRKARRHPVVARSATVAAIACSGAGWRIARAASERAPDAIAWIVLASLVAACIAAADGFRTWRLFRASLVLPIVAVVALWEPVIGVAIMPAAGFVTGAALRTSTHSTTAALRSAAAAWVTIASVGGAAFGGLLWFFDPQPYVPVVIAALTVAVAMRRPRAVRPDPLPAPFTGGVFVRGLSVHLGDDPVISDLELMVSPGRIVGIAGANGAGKSTLLRTIAGEIRPTSGTIRAAGMDALTSSPDELARAGVVLVEANHGSNGELTVHDNLRVASLLRNRDPAVATQLARAIHPTLTDAAHERAAVLSGGERRLLGLTQALVATPRVLLADELGRGLATAQRVVLADALRELASRGCAVIVVEHDPVFLASVSDVVVHLHDGRVYDSAAITRSER